MKDRVFGLDIMRFIAIMLVVVGHGASLMPSFPEIAIAVSYVDFLGVEIFFVLSGFLIGSILINSFEKEGVDFGVIRKFWIRRWWRTIPNYFLFLVVNYVGFMILKPDFVFDWRFLFFLQNLFYLPEKFFSVSWSLTVEEWFYLIIPLLVFAFYRFLSNVKKSFLISAVFIVAIVMLYRFFYICSHDPQWNEELRRVVVFRLDSLLYGVLGAFLRFYFPRIFEGVRYWGVLAGTLLLVLAILLRFDEELNDSVFERTILFPLISLGCLLYLPWLSSIKTASGGLGVRIVTSVSIWSYSLYLVHVPLMDFMSYILKGYLGHGIIDLFIFFGWMILAIFLSAIIYSYYERPLTNLRDFKSTYPVMRRPV